MSDIINKEIYSLIVDLDRMLNNALAIAVFDREVYVKRYGEELVSFVERQAEFMGQPAHNIQNSLNMAYDKGFTDCAEMVQRVIGKYCIDEVSVL